MLCETQLRIKKNNLYFLLQSNYREKVSQREKISIPSVQNPKKKQIWYILLKLEPHLIKSIFLQPKEPTEAYLICLLISSHIKEDSLLQPSYKVKSYKQFLLTIVSSIRLETLLLKQIWIWLWKSAESQTAMCTVCKKVFLNR